MENVIEIKPAQTKEDFLAAKKLIFEYVEWLGIDLAFQNFDKEIETMPVTYGEPDGGLFIVLRNNVAVGVAGIKRFNKSECEIKRMFVQNDSRGFGIGKLLMTECISLAKRLNYEAIKLDTAGYMKSAIKLYEAHGFVEIPSYRHNPHEDAKYFELKLRRS